MIAQALGGLIVAGLYAVTALVLCLAVIGGLLVIAGVRCLRGRCPR